MKLIGNSWLAACALGLVGLSIGCGGSTVGVGGSGGAAGAGSSAAGGVGATAGAAGAVGGIGADCTVAPVPRAQFQQQLAAVLCDGVAPCCSAANVPYTEASCKSIAMQASLELLPDSESLRTYDPAGAARCLCALQQELASCQQLDEAVETACRGISVGTLPVGSNCTRSVDCAPPGYCKTDPNQVDSPTCTDDGGSNYPHGNAGDPCRGSCDSEQQSCFAIGSKPIGDKYCYRSDGVHCALDTNLCKPLGQVGEPCTPFGNSCASGEYCNTAGKCAAQTESGQCSDGGSAACTSDSYCLGGQCRGPRKADGEPCLQSVECAGNICAGADGETPGSCTRETAASGHRCEGGLK